MRKYKNLPEHEIYQRLFALYIPKSIAIGMASEISKWTTNNGPEWTVKRLKALKTDYIQILAGNAPVSQWVKYYKGFPMGSFGKLFRYGLKNHSEPKVQYRVLNALNSHTSFLSLVETEAQISKFYNSVASEKSDDFWVDEIFESHCLQVTEKLSVDPKIGLRTIKDYVPGNKKRCPSSDGTTLPEKKWLDTVSCIWETSLGSNLWYKYTQLRSVLNPIATVVERKLALPAPWLKTGAILQSQGFAGKIGHIQEPGLKLRAVANPFRVYQLALSRLGDQLYKLVKTLPWDCTHDQEEGVAWASKKLEDGHTMFAVDLSDATNVFPLSLQIQVLSSIKHIHTEDVMLLEELATAPWLSPTQGLVTWTKGQPLGLYPSFGLFTLTHGVLLRGLEQSLRLSDSFRVLGDDVVISDPKLHKEYRNVLEKLEMPVSEDKTLISDQITEFGGRIIFPGSAISIGKWRSVSDRNFMDLLRNIGPRFLRNLQPRQRKVAEMIMTLPEPVGLGLNPKGLSAEARWALEEKLSYLFEPKYRLPLYGKQPWPGPLIETEVIQPFLFENKPLSGNWDGPTSWPIQSSRDSQGSPEPSCIVELHSRLKESTGVATSPSTQVAHLSMSYPDMLDLVKQLAGVMGLVQSITTGDPRGTTALEYWEQAIKAGKSPSS